MNQLNCSDCDAILKSGMAGSPPGSQEELYFSAFVNGWRSDGPMWYCPDCVPRRRELKEEEQRMLNLNGQYRI